jgi:putative peptidoglycan lipid II flippase
MKLYRAFATVGGLTMVSRVLGFFRDILIAAALGSGAIADAFFVAFRFPNLFRRLFAEGAFNAAFVPLFGKHLNDGGQDKARTFAEETLSVLLLVLVVFSGLAIAGMPWLMALLAPGFLNDPVKYDLAVTLTQIAFPYLLCMSLVAMLSGILNSMHRFWLAAAAPILLNIVLIAAILFAIQRGYAERPEAGYVLALGVFVSGFAQLAALWIGVRQAGVRLKLQRPRYTDGVKRLVQLGIPGVISGGITQINIVVGTIIASLQAGAVSYLYYADRLYQLPLGIVGIAVGVVLLPELVRNLREGDRVSVMDSQNRSLEFALMLTLPATVALFLAAEPIIQVLFERGAFSSSDTPQTAAALAAFAIGLPAFVLIKVLQPAFFAREDTQTPMRFAAINLVVNVVLSLALFFTFQWLGWKAHVGIALATSIAAWVNTVLLWEKLRRGNDLEPDQRLVRNLKWIAVASLLMGALVWVMKSSLAGWFAPEAGLLWQVLALGLLVGSGLVVFAAAIIGSGVLKIDQIGRFLRRA